MESLSEPFIRRPVATTLVMLAILIAGISAFYNLPVSDLPNVDYPVISVQASLTGASPEVVANTLASPLETEFMTIPGLKVVHSTSSYGYTNITLEFKVDKKMDAAAQDVEAALSRASPFLPPTMRTKPTYIKQNPSQEPILYFALTSATMTLPELYEYGDQIIGKRLSMVDGVAHVRVYGPKHQIDVRVDPLTLTAKEMGMGDVKDQIVAGNPHLPSGQLEGEVSTITLNAIGQLENKEQYSHLIIKKADGSYIRLEDVANVFDGPREDYSYFRYIKGKIDQPTIVLAVQRLPGANSVRVSKDIEAILPSIEMDLPLSVSLKKMFDRSDSIKSSIHDVEWTLIIALILVVTIIYVYLGRAADTIIPSIVLPISIIGTFFAMYWLGYSLDNLSLLALTLCIGFVVDDAIVVIENIVRHIEEGQSPMQAALAGSKQISFTVLSMTISLVASFIPLLFMGGLVGKVFREFAVTLSVAILISGFVSLTLTPMLASRFLRKRNHDQRTFLARMGDEFNHKALNLYKSALRGALVHQELTWGLALGSLVGLIILFKVLPMKFIPGDDIGYLFVVIQTKEGLATLKQIDHQKEVTKLLQNEPGVDEFVAWNFSGQGAMFVKLKPISKREPTKDIVQRLNGQLFQIPGIRGFVSSVPLLNFSLGEGGDDRYRYRLRSSDFDELVKYTELMTEKLRSVQGLQQVTNNLEMNKPQLNIDILHDWASLYAVSAADIEMTLLNAYAGATITTIDKFSAQYDVTFGLEDKYQKDASSLDQLYVKSRKGDKIPLSSVSHWSETVGPKAVYHTNRFPSANISFTLDKDLPLDRALEIIRKTARETLPATITGKSEGAAEVFEETLGFIAFLIVIAVVVSYLVLGTLYESFIHPITILSTLPLAMLGGLITLLLFGESLSLYSMVGLILLIGIIKKNGIIMVDYAIEAEKQHNKNSVDAIYEAAVIRFRPIMMTTIAAIMGALPIAIGVGASGAVRKPLGLVIVGGLLISQMFTLFVIPVVYLAFDRLEKRFTTRKAQTDF